jgi:hypothetical protein
MDQPSESQVQPPVVRVPKPATKEEVSVLGKMVSECMLSQYWFTVGGVVAGTALALRKKNLRLYVGAVSFGVMGDLFHGYTGPCRGILDDYERAKKSLGKVETVLEEKVKDK